MGKGRSAAQPSISEPVGGWVGKGQGRGAGQPTVKLSAWVSIERTPSVAEQMPSSMDDPEGNYVFALEIDGVEIAHFSECSGLKTTTEVFEIQEGGMNDRVHKIPGQSKWENITLRYGVTSDTSLLGWRNEILQDQFQEDKRRNGSIVLKDNQMQVVRRYNFKAAWPVSWEGPSLSASGSELAVEMLEIAHHGIEIT
jgi:phage tail-like protein